MLGRWALVAAVGLVGCGSRDNEKASRPPAELPAQPAAQPADGAPPAEEKHVFDVTSSADLLSLRSEYMRLWDTGFDGTLEVNVAAGDYPAQGWDLFPASDSTRKTAAPTIDVVLRGAPAVIPPPSRARVRKLRIEGLVFAAAGSPWQLEVADELVMVRSMVIDGRGRKFDTGTPSVIVLGYGTNAGGKPSPVRARLESSWFVRNWQSETDQSMLGFASVRNAPSYWDSIEIDDCAFLGNAYAVSIDVEFAKTMRVTRSLFYKPWPSGVLIKSTSSGDIVFDDSVIITESIDHIAAHGAESPPIKLGAGTRVYVKGWTAGTKPPATLVADPSQIRDRAALAAGESELAQAVQLPATALPEPDLKARLDRAARP